MSLGSDHPRVLRPVALRSFEIDDPKVAEYVAELETFMGQAELVIERLNADRVALQRQVDARC